MMSLWRREALERFPELRLQISGVDGVRWIWFELWYAVFKPAYEEDPPNTVIIARVYDYALWSLRQRSIHVRTAVIIDFFEKIPDHPRMRQDMPLWISQDSFDMLQFAWEYSTKEPFAAFRQEFIRNKVRVEKEEKWPMRWPK